METNKLTFPPLENLIVYGNCEKIDKFMKKEDCVILSLGLLKTYFNNAIHGIRAVFAYAKKHGKVLYIRHLEDFHHDSSIHELKQLAIAFEYAQENKIKIIAFATDRSKVYNFMLQYFKKSSISEDDASSLVDPIKSINFNSVIGRETVKTQLMNIYKSKNSFESIIFHGLPGKGKTMMARAYLQEIVAIGGSPTFINVQIQDILKSHVGEGERALSRLFNVGSDCIFIFIDELDVIFGSDENYICKILWQLHAELDKLKDRGRGKIIVIGATNYIDLIPKSLMRRFQNIIFFD
eukprot:NODE_52_length_30984_cov_1.383358.p16 type:complete len:294 gc:universal NODE_52_length_30984_cov_1.383358:26234-25353(-)